MKYIKKILQILQIISGNSSLRKKICEKNPGTFTEIRRNFEVLVIGEMYDVKKIINKDKTYLQFDAPNRTLFASFLILQGKFSWLKEGKGKCIIICKKSNEEKKNISMFDVPFLHSIIINKYNLKRQQTELIFPLLFHPLQVFKFLFGKRYNMSSVEKCPFPEIEDFCAQRNIELEYRVISK
jgi:hypothetical protein